jgi:hypothetical protein
MNASEWSRKYEVLSISRVSLSSLGFTTEQINALSDEDMDRIAYWLENQMRDQGFDESVKFIASLELAEKGVPLYGSSEEPLCEEG